LSDTSRHRLDKNRLDKNSIDKNSIDKNSVDKNSVEEYEGKDEPQQNTISKIINYLNLVLKTRYSSKTKATRELINARLKEKYTLDDFKQVIDIKNSEWSGDSKTAVWLRPSTLFGNKFESYLNQKPKSVMDGLPQNLRTAFELAEKEQNKPREINIFEQIRNEQDPDNNSGGISEL